MSHLESLIVEYLDWQGYLVRRSPRVGKLGHGGWEMELDVVGYHPARQDLVHYQPSVAAHSWSMREERYKKKFDAGRKYIRQHLFAWLPTYDRFIEPILQFLAAHPEGASAKDAHDAAATAPGIAASLDRRLTIGHLPRG